MVWHDILVRVTTRGSGGIEISNQEYEVVSGGLFN